VNGPALLGLAAFVGVFTFAGYGVLVALQGHGPWRQLPRDLGLAYLLGVAALGSLLTLQVVIGIPLSVASILISASVLCIGGVVVGRRRVVGRPPALRSTRPAEYVVAAGLVVLTLIVLAASFRAARLQGLLGWDAGSFWVPKAEAIFFTGGLDETHFTTLPGPSYPPLVPVLQAVFFHLGGGVDVVGLHLAYWSILAGFVAAAVRLLSPLARPALAWAGVLLVIVADQLATEADNPQGDVLMDLLLGLGVLCLIRWLVGRERGLFAGCLVFLCAAALVKREALLVIVCIAVALFVAEARRLRTIWPWALALVVVPFAVTVPWRVWFTRRSLPGDGPEAGPLALFDHLDRVLPSVRLVLEAMADPVLWSVIFVVGVLTVVAALFSGERRISVFALTFLVLATAGFVWVMWSFPSLPLTKTGALNPIPRLVGAALVPLALVVPILLTEVVRRTVPESGGGVPTARLRASTVATAAVLVLAYPAAVLAFSGAPRFPSRDDCAALASPVEDGSFLAVYERHESLRAALETRDRLLEMGFTGTEVRSDGCGRWEVANPSVVTVDQARGHAEDARRAGFDLRLERA
jgi:hypothetical protein